MQIFTVGGAVRDELLGLTVQDRDYVVVGATPAEMLAQGFKPVGKDFPVFLHPQTHAEYALARTERKAGHGYRGFVFDAAREVTLEEDLARRDLTINAIARADDGTLTDPFHGVDDLAARVLRHVGPAFVEDPVRLLRVARFAARFHDFSVAPETVDLMRAMVAGGEIDHLVAERVWQEFARGLMEARPSRMLAVLDECGALARLLPEIDRGADLRQALDAAARCGQALAVRFAVLLRAPQAPAVDAAAQAAQTVRKVKQIDALCARIKAPTDCRDLALLVARYDADIRHGAQLSATGIAKLLEAADALRRPQRFKQLLDACAGDGADDCAASAGALFLRALDAARAVDAATIARDSTGTTEIAQRVHAARVAAVKAALTLPE
jgi:tRNA nucleotidyltransferase (CCA-adding enzyme)